MPLPHFLLQKDLLEIQFLLNSSETSLHQLTAMLDCRGLHKVWGAPKGHPEREVIRETWESDAWAPCRLWKVGGSADFSLPSGG